ncbi:MAG: ATPase [Deltaproteobacteria bacterium]|nr:MAG: ATPase [Deltaproteobacteria bacterium]
MLRALRMELKQRTFWLRSIEELWEKRSVIWLSGVRRVGKTCLCRSLSDIEYFDCELPRTRRSLADPEGFLASLRGRRVVLDEIHRLQNPSEFLKLAADYFSHVKLIATGSSTLGASAKFRDTLTGRKANLWLTPMIRQDLIDFGNTDLKHRLLRGGLPPFFMESDISESDFQEWIDSYWAKDIQELFRLERRYAFQRFAELLFAQSGGIFEATRFSRPCEVSRTTISNYLNVFEATFVAHIIRPYSTHRPAEIVSAPKVYAFDTGFVCYHRDYQHLRPEDMGLLWEHFVLNELNGRLQSRDVRYWRDKRGHEVDFVLTPRSKPPIAIECKWSADDFDKRGLEAFRRRYPQGSNFVVSQDVDRPFKRSYKNLVVDFVSLETLIDMVSHM